MKTAISTPDPLFQAAQRLARRLGLSRSEVFQRAVQAFLQAHEKADVTATLNEIYGEGGEPARLDRILEKIQAASLPEEEW